MTARVNRNNMIVIAKMGDLMLKIITALSIAVEENQGLAFTSFYVVQLYITHGFINRLRSSSENFSIA